MIEGHWRRGEKIIRSKKIGMRNQVWKRTVFDLLQ